MERRDVLVAVCTAVGGTVVAGCTGGGRGSDDGTASSGSPTDPTGDDAPTSSSPGTAAATGDGSASTVAPVDEPDSDIPIHVENRHDATHTISVTVANDGTFVHEGTYELEPGAARTVYNLREADPDGVEPYGIEATLGDRTESVTVRTNSCHGEVHVSITEDGDLSATYSIC